MYYSSPCLTYQHGKCKDKACRCVCHDKVCTACDGRGYYKKAGHKWVCGVCRGSGRIRFQRKDVTVTISPVKNDSDCPF